MASIVAEAHFPPPKKKEEVILKVRMGQEPRVARGQPRGETLETGIVGIGVKYPQSTWTGLVQMMVLVKKTAASIVAWEMEQRPVCYRVKQPVTG